MAVFYEDVLRAWGEGGLPTMEWFHCNRIIEHDKGRMSDYDVYSTDIYAISIQRECWDDVLIEESSFFCF